MSGTRGGAEAGRYLRERVDDLARASVERQFAADPGLDARYGPEGRRRCAEDGAHHLRHLAEAVALGTPALFVDYITWARDLLAPMGIGPEDVRAQLEVLEDVVRDALPEPTVSPVIGCLHSARAALAQGSGPSASALTADDEPTRLARGALEALLAYRPESARRQLLGAVEEGLTLETLYVRVLQPMLHEVGRLWQIGRIGVADEHYCTAALQSVMSQLHGRVFAAEPTRGRMLVACVGDELHEIGARMLADLAAVRGWDALYLGANTPTRAFRSAVERHSPHVVAVSSTMVWHLPEVERLLRSLEDLRRRGGRVIVGGRPFTLDPELSRRVGADGSAPEAQAAIRLAEELVA